MKIYNKLIRDKIPKIIKEANKEYEIEILEDKRYVFELKKKLIEESKELLEAKTKAEEIEELADIYEVIESFISFKNLSKEEIEKVKKEKANKRGNFKDKIFLKNVK